MGIIKHDQPGHYDIEPISAPAEVKDVIEALLGEWEAWSARMRDMDTKQSSGIGATINICILEVRALFAMEEASS